MAWKMCKEYCYVYKCNIIWSLSCRIYISVIKECNISYYNTLIYLQL